MAVQKYDIRKPEMEGGEFQERYWSPVNSPVFGTNNDVVYIIHRVEDVTEFVRAKQRELEQKKLAEELRTHACRMEAEVYQRAEEVQEVNRRLEAANQQLSRELNERKRVQEALRLSEESFRLLVERMQDYAIFLLDSDGLVASWNSGAERIKGYKASEILGKHFSCFYPSKEVEACAPESLLEVAKKEGHVAEEGWRVRKDGSRFWANVVITALRNGQGKLLGFSKVTRDMTDRKKLEESLRTSEEKFRKVAETAKDAIISSDSQGNIIYANRAAEETFNYCAHEIIGRPVTLLMPERFRTACAQEIERFSRTGESNILGKTVELTGRRKDGTEFPVQLSMSSWTTSEGTFLTSILSDITERKQTQEALVHAKEEAERANKFKDQFLSTMSHELRTPLNAVLGFSDLLADERYGSLNDRQQRYVSHINASGKHLLKLISDILDLSKIEAGRMDLALEDMVVASAFAEVVSSLHPLAEKKSQVLIQRAKPDLYVRADPVRLKQVLMNLVGNAVKFAPQGGRIELVARRADDKVRIEVRDNGPGIPPEEQQRIFEAFFRLTKAKTSSEGTGLGLAIAASLVALHGDKLRVDSYSKSETCFYFSLPLAGPVPQQTIQTATVLPRISVPPRVLAIEDNPLTGQLLKSQLATAGYETSICSQPERALEMAVELRPDAITLDLIMKPVHGLDVLQQLKNDSRTAKIPVIVVTIVDEPSMGTALGADEYLVKPVDKATLLAAVERCLRRRSSATPPKTILVVEDDAPAREVIVDLLAAHGYDVNTAADGAQARTITAESLPSLVILDLLLPKISGFELLAEWRANARTAHLPIFVLTSKELTQEQEEFLRGHAESVFKKQNAWRDPLIQQLERLVGSAPTAAVNS